MKKTRLEAFMEALPNTELGDNGYPWSCVYTYDQTQRYCEHEGSCAECKKRFWDEKIEIPVREPNDSEKILAALNELNSKVEQLETLIRVSYPTNVSGVPSNRIPEVKTTLLRAIHTGGEVIIPKEDSNVKMD